MNEKNLQENKIDVSVLIPVSERHDNLQSLFIEHKKVLDRKNLSHEFIFIIDGDFKIAEAAVKKIAATHGSLIKLIKLNRTYGEAKALTVGFLESSGELILTLASYFQIQPQEIEKLFSALTSEIDVVFGCRFPRKDNVINRIQSQIFHKIVNKISKVSFSDISCGVRLMRREVMSQINLYGDMHRFIPLLALNKGFRVKEVPLQQASEDIHLRVYKPGVYIRRLLDLFTLFFLIKFTLKPLRFFGLLACVIGFLGIVMSGITIWQRYFFDQRIADRPLFLAGILFILIGLQTFFIGLVAEIIIFTHSPKEPFYNIEKIIE